MPTRLKSYLATLDLVAQLNGVQIGLPAHGHPFNDVPGRVEAIKEHHAERMELLRRAGLALGPATVVDLSHEVFPKRHWGTMAESETFAHLEHLAACRRRGVLGGARHARVPNGARVGRGMTLLDDGAVANESVDLLAHLIRNECVNDGTAESGFESRSADVLAQYLGDTGLELERYVRRPAATTSSPASRAAIRAPRRCCSWATPMSCR